MTKLFLLGANKEIDTAVQVVKENQIIIGHGAYSTENRYVVYKVEYLESNWGNNYQYHVIDLETKAISEMDIIRPLSQKFGIGTYYDDVNPEFMDTFEVVILLQKAQEIRANQIENEREEEKRREEIKAIGRKRLTEILPQNAQAIIIACEKENTSRIEDDYYGSKTLRTIILGFSTHKKDIFSEMRKHAKNFEGTAYLAEYNKDYEHREKYSMGKGYYLGEDYYQGWIIKKAPIYDRQKAIEEFSYTAGQTENIRINDTAIENAHIPTSESINTENLHLEIVDYSEKAIALFGDTKAIKDTLKAMGGKFNPKLTHKGGKQAGWIFSKTKRDALNKILNLKN